MDSPTSFLIVLLEDCSSSAELVELILEQHLPCKVQTYRSAEALFAQSPMLVPDLYLIDVRLISGSEGIDACYQLRRDPKQKQVPVVFFSAHANPQTRVAALRAGGIDYIDKPFYPEELITRIQGHLNLHSAHKHVLATSEEQQALLRILCHDLKNPVGGAFSLLEFLRDEPDKDPDILQMALESCQNALDIIDHVQAQRHLLHGKQDHGTEVVQVSDALGNCVRTMRPVAELKNLQIEVFAPPQLHIRVNRVLFCHSIINNLLHNAIKFSHPQGKVSILASCIPGADAELCQIEIRDQGIGMQDEILATLFQDAGVASRSGTRNETGSGYGMALVKRYVEKSGGNIRIRSVAEDPHRPGQASGTKIFLSFPICDPRTAN